MNREGRLSSALAVVSMAGFLALGCAGPPSGEAQVAAERLTVEEPAGEQGSSSGVDSMSRGEPAETGQTEPRTYPSRYPAGTPKMAIRVTVPKGTTISLALLDPLSSERSTVGDTFRAKVDQAIVVEDRVAIPVDSVVRGTVREVQSATRVKGRALLNLVMEEIQLPDGQRMPLAATLITQAEGTRKRDTAIIGGSAAGGAILGKVLGDKDKDTLKGAILGGAIGTGVVLANKGKEVELLPESPLGITLDEPLTVKVPG